MHDHTAYYIIAYNYIICILVVTLYTHHNICEVCSPAHKVNELDGYQNVRTREAAISSMEKNKTNVSKDR